MNQTHHASVTPTQRNHIQVVLECGEIDMNVSIDQLHREQVSGIKGYIVKELAEPQTQ
jgi:hypothetical protein